MCKLLIACDGEDVGNNLTLSLPHTCTCTTHINMSTVPVLRQGLSLPDTIIAPRSLSRLAVEWNRCLLGRPLLPVLWRKVEHCLRGLLTLVWTKRHVKTLLQCTCSIQYQNTISMSLTQMTGAGVVLKHTVLKNCCCVCICGKRLYLIACRRCSPMLKLGLGRQYKGPLLLVDQIHSGMKNSLCRSRK